MLLRVGDQYCLCFYVFICVHVIYYVLICDLSTDILSGYTAPPHAPLPFQPSITFPPHAHCTSLPLPLTSPFPSSFLLFYSPILFHYPPRSPSINHSLTSFPQLFFHFISQHYTHLINAPLHTSSFSSPYGFSLYRYLTSIPSSQSSTYSLHLTPLSFHRLISTHIIHSSLYFQPSITLSLPHTHSHHPLSPPKKSSPATSVSNISLLSPSSWSSGGRGGQSVGALRQLHQQDPEGRQERR